MNYSVIFLLTTVLCSAQAMAGSDSANAAIGGAIGGGLGAYVGSEIGGQSGAVIGGAVGGATGAGIATSGSGGRVHSAPVAPAVRVAPPYEYRYAPPAPSHFCPPGQAKKGRC